MNSRDLLPNIRLLISTDEMVGKRIVAITWPATRMLVVFDDETAIVFGTDYDETDPCILVNHEPDIDALAWDYGKLGLIDEETHRRFQYLRRDEIWAEELAKEQKEYERLKAIFEPEK